MAMFRQFEHAIMLLALKRFFTRAQIVVGFNLARRLKHRQFTQFSLFSADQIALKQVSAIIDLDLSICVHGFGMLMKSLVLHNAHFDSVVGVTTQ